MIPARRFFLALAFLAYLGFPSIAKGAPTCIAQPDWSDYVFAYPGGCTIGDALISDFGGGRTDIRFPTPLTTPDSIGLEFSLLDPNPFTPSSPFSAGSNQVKTFAVSFTTTMNPGADLIGGDLFSLIGAEITGTGTITATEITCLGGIVPVPLTTPSGCSSGTTTSSGAAFPQVSGAATFAPLASIGTVLSMTLSGGSAGTARITGFRMIATQVPEPSSLLLVGAGLVTFAVFLRRRPVRRSTT